MVPVLARDIGAHEPVRGPSSRREFSGGDLRTGLACERRSPTELFMCATSQQPTRTIHFGARRIGTRSMSAESQADRPCRQDRAYLAIVTGDGRPERSRPVDTAYCLLPTAYCLLPTAYCTYCLLTIQSPPRSRPVPAPDSEDPFAPAPRPERWPRPDRDTTCGRPARCTRERRRLRCWRWRPRRRAGNRPRACVPRVSRRELPLLGGVVDSSLEPTALLLFGNVEEELDDRRAFVREEPLELKDVSIALLPPRLRDQVVDPNDQYVFVVAAVEDHDLTVPRNVTGGPSRGSRGQVRGQSVA